jgi:glycosyltransferase involved in cell wall biosynthesis
MTFSSSGGKTRPSTQPSVIFWQYILTEHQSDTLEEFSKLPDVSSRVIALKTSDKERDAQGWKDPKLEGVTLLTGAPRKVLSDAIRIFRENSGAIHVFNSMWGSKIQFIFFLHACLRRAKIALVSEPYSEIPLGYLREQSRLVSWMNFAFRRLAYPLAGLFFRWRVRCILAISPVACRQFEKAGFKRDFIYPYGYFVRATSGGGRTRKGGDGPRRLVYVGTLLKRKGFDIACAAVSRAVQAGYAVSLDLFGALGVNGVPPPDVPGIRYRGMIEFGQTASRLAEYDAIIVPSRFDGWSVVVNEAIQAGTPVIVSENVGASAMVSSNSLGLVYDGTEKGLLQAIQTVVERPEFLPGWREAEKKFAPLLDPAVAAKYIQAALNCSFNGASRPVCSWY